MTRHIHQTSLVRLDTAWRTDDPQRLRTLGVGDTTSRATAWSGAVRLTLSRSSNNNQFNPRHLASAADDRLTYDLFTDPARTSIWGDGTDGTVTSGGDGDTTSAHHTIYGRIPAGQNVRIGTYSDLITVTLEF